MAPYPFFDQFELLLIAEQLVKRYLLNGSERLEVIHIQVTGITEETIDIGTTLNPLLLT